MSTAVSAFIANATKEVLLGKKIGSLLWPLIAAPFALGSAV